MLDKDLALYIQQQKAAGISEPVYRQTLKSQGWSDEDITAASFIGTASTPPIAPVNNNDRIIAAYSLWMLVIVSIFHIVWLGLKNKFLLVSLTNFEAFRYSTSIVLWSIIAGIVILNFLPVFLSIRLYKKGEYKKQLLISLISFVICQILLHFMIVVFLSGFGGMGC